MTLSLSGKLFLSFIALTCSVLIATMILARWSFNQGFLDYVNSLDQLRLQRIARDVVEHYSENDGDWSGFGAANFDRIVRRHSLPPPPPEWYRPRPHDGAASIDHPPALRYPPHPPKIYGQKTALIDQHGEHIAGDLISQDNNLVEIPVMLDDTRIGRLQAIVVRRLDSPLATAFSRQQARASLVIGTIALILAGLTSYFLTRVLRTPILAAISSVERLARGDYSPLSAHAPATNNKTTSIINPSVLNSKTPADTNSSNQLACDNQSGHSSKTGDELQRLHSNLEHLRVSLKEGSTARRRLMADVSHELRTPLTILTGEIDALKDGLRAFDSKQLDSLDQEVTRLRHLVEDLHQLSLSDVGGLRYQFEPTSLHACISTSISSLQTSATNSGLVIHFADANSSNKPALLLADAKRLTQLFTNLLSNSITYTSAPGTIYICIVYKNTVENKSENTAGDVAHVTIEDTPPGIAAEHHEQLFESFYRREGSGSRLFGGAGLGLAICRNIVIAHRGTIIASNSQYGGLRMDIKLPLEVHSIQ